MVKIVLYIALLFFYTVLVQCGKSRNLSSREEGEGGGLLGTGGLVDIMRGPFGGIMGGPFGDQYEPSTEGDRCYLDSDCRRSDLYCTVNRCSTQKAGRDCVDRGEFPTGGKKCCLPMTTPQLNKPCRLYDPNGCKTDIDCVARNGNSLPYCCPNASKGNGKCVDTSKDCALLS